MGANSIGCIESNMKDIHVALFCRRNQVVKRTDEIPETGDFSGRTGKVSKRNHLLALRQDNGF